MSRLSVLPVSPLPSRLGSLMACYADNYWRLLRVFAPLALPEGVYRSTGNDGLPLRFEVLARHAYTLELRLTYEWADPHSGQPDPSAMIRLYSDAQLAEVTHFEVSNGLSDLLDLWPMARALIDQRLRQNRSLSRWLQYLEEQGHHRFGLQGIA